MSSLTEAELDCLRRYVELLAASSARRSTRSSAPTGGRQIAPAFQTQERLAPALGAGIEADGRRLWPTPAATVAW